MNRLKSPWVIISVVLATVVGISFFYYRRVQSLEIHYREIKTKREDITVTVLATGTVQPENRLEIKPPVAGRVEQVVAREGQRVKKGQILAWMSSTERAAVLDAARAQGPEEVKKWEENYRATPILAPINGTLILRNVESGQTFSNSDAVFVMSDRLTVKAQVDETDISQVKLHQKAAIVLDAYPKVTVPAQVDEIAFDAKTVNNVTTYDVDVLPNEIPEFMRSGMTANVRFFVEAKTNLVVIPNDALRVHDNRFFVLVPDPERHEPMEVPIEKGITDGKRTEILSGLNDGDVVLVADIKSKKGPQQGTNPFSPTAPQHGRR